MLIAAIIIGSVFAYGFVGMFTAHKLIAAGNRNRKLGSGYYWTDSTDDVIDSFSASLLWPVFLPLLGANRLAARLAHWEPKKRPQLPEARVVNDR